MAGHFTRRKVGLGVLVLGKLSRREEVDFRNRMFVPASDFHFFTCFIEFAAWLA